METETNNPLVKVYVPYVVKHVTEKNGFPKNEEELIMFCQALTQNVIKKIEPIIMN